MLLLYKILTWLLYPVYLFYLTLLRLLIDKDNKAYYMQRLGYYNIKKPNKDIIWLNAVSVGESLSLLPIVKKLLQDFPNVQILFTSTTLSSAKVVTEKFPAAIIHQFIVADFPWCVKRFLRYWQPQAAIFVESELWPNILLNIGKNKIPAYLLNLCLSPQSLQKWQLCYKSFVKILTIFDLILTQNKKLLEHLKCLPHKNIHFLGNLKLTGARQHFNQQLIKDLTNSLNTRKIWVAASTHATEAKIIIDTHSQVKKHLPTSCLILVPRHQNHYLAISQLLKNNNLSCINYSDYIQNYQQKIIADVLIVDQLGILPLFYNHSDVALIGGSLVPGIGGHNAIEAIAYNCIPLYGPYVANFAEIFKTMEYMQASIAINDVQNLANNIIKLLQNSTLRQKYLNGGNSFIKQNNQVIQQIYGALNKELVKNIQITSK